MVIPDDWQEVRLGDIGRLRGGVGFPLRFQGRKTAAIPFYKVSDMNLPGNEIFMRDSNNWVSEADCRALGAAPLPAGSIVFAKVGAAVFLERKRILSRSSCVDNNMMALIPEVGRCDTRFVHFALQQVRFGDLVSATALPSINGSGVAGIVIPLPPRREQESIAEALGDADSAIEALDALIAKKRDVKQAAMQFLVPASSRGLRVGRSAAPGALPLSEFAELHSGVYLPADAYQGGRFEVQGAGARMGWHSAATELSPCTVIGRVGTVGRPRFLGEGCWVNNNAAALVARSTKAEPRYLHLLLEGFAWSGVVSSTAQPFLMVSDLMSAVCELPNLPEQERISSTLFDIDAEIEALAAQRDKMRLVKQGMMQELLSGRVRLV